MGLGAGLVQKMRLNKNALSSVESRLLGDKIRNEEAIRPQAVVLVSSEPRGASEKVELCSPPTVPSPPPKIRDFSQSTERGFPRLKFFNPFFIDGRVFFRIFTFCIVFDDLFLN